MISELPYFINLWKVNKDNFFVLHNKRYYDIYNTLCRKNLIRFKQIVIKSYRVQKLMYVRLKLN